MAVLRLFGVLLAFLCVAYAGLWMYVRAAQKERLAAEWRATRPPLPEHRFVSNGLEALTIRTRRRLVVAVFVIPIAVFGAIVWFTEAFA
jgi:hypothetical protein